MNDNLGTITIDLKLDNASFSRALATSEAKAAATGTVIDKELAGATGRSTDKFSTLGTVATKALTTTGIAAGVAGAFALKMAGDFEQSLNIFQSVSGATAKQMELVAAKARELGKDASLPGISSKDAADALTELAKAGLNVNESLAASKGVLSLAKAGNLGVADAASTSAKALNAFNLKGEQAVQVADLLAAAANASTASVDDIGLGLAQVGPGAKQMGVSLKDTVAALALFSNAGIRGQDAGTSLKQMFIQLAAPSKKASDLMHQLGLNFFDAQGNFIGLEKASGLLNTKLAKMTTEQRNSALATIFGSDSMRVAAVLADAGAKGFDNMADAVGRQGAATDLAAAQNKGFNGALDNLKSTLETVATDLGSKILPEVTNALRDLSTGITNMANDAIPILVEAFKVVIAVVRGTFEGIGFLIDQFKRGNPIVQGLAVFLGVLVAGLVLFNAAMAIGAAVTGAFAAAVAIVTSPVFLVIAAIAALAAIVFVLIKNWSSVSKFFADLWDGIKKGVVGFVNFMVEAGQNLIGGLVKGISDSSKAVINKIKEICASALDQVKKFFGISSPSKVMAQMGQFMMQGLADGIESAGSQATAAMSQVSSDLLGALVVPSGTLNVSGDGSLAAGSTGAAGAGIVQNNTYNISKQVDLELAKKDANWELANA